jgi:membrane-associated protease RseP (regulator of RpoE activity)
MANIFGTILAFTVVFGILVFVHEFGHFFTAKLIGVRVEVFSFGYGKRLFGIKRGDTDYRISLIPMGGYVKLLGEGMFEKDRPVAPDDMMAKTRFERFLIMAMGSVMNLILAVVIVAFMNGVGISVPEYQDEKPVIGWIETGSPAEKAGLKVDDEILRIGGRQVKTWSDVELAVGSKPDRLVRLEIRRDGGVLPVDLQTESVTRYQMGYAGFRGKILTQIQMVLPNSPAEKAGLKPGDVILAVEGKAVYFYQFIQVLEKNPNKELQFSLEQEIRLLRGHRPVVQGEPAQRFPGHPLHQGPLHGRGLDPPARRPARDRQLLLRGLPHGLDGPPRLDRRHQPPARGPEPLPHPGLRRRPDLRPHRRGDHPPRPRPQGPSDLDADRVRHLRRPDRLRRPQRHRQAAAQRLEQPRAVLGGRGYGCSRAGRLVPSRSQASSSAAAPPSSSRP